MDRAWWRFHHQDVNRQFRGLKVCVAERCFGTQRVRFEHGKNSGAGAMSLAAHWGARRIILLGYDCQYTGGQRHWHGDHPKGLGNAVSMPKWAAQFAEMAKHLDGVEIINASRETAIDLWPRMTLEKALHADTRRPFDRKPGHGSSAPAKYADAF